MFQVNRCWILNLTGSSKMGDCEKLAAKYGSYLRADRGTHWLISEEIQLIGLASKKILTQKEKVFIQAFMERFKKERKSNDPLLTLLNFVLEKSIPSVK